MSSTNFPELVNFIQECDVKLFKKFKAIYNVKKM